MIKPEDWSALPEGIAKTIFVDYAVAKLEQIYLEKAGYKVVDVRTLPRETPEQNKKAVQAWLQGMADGTIEADDEKRKNLELSAKLDGLLVNKSVSMKLNSDVTKDTLDELLDFGSSRHTLKQASPEKFEKAKVLAITSRKKKKNGKIRKNKN